MEDPVEKWKRIKEQAQANTSKDVDLEYLIRTQGKRDRWQLSTEDNVDVVYGTEMDVYIPTETQLLKQVLLFVKLKAWRSYAFQTKPVEAGATNFTISTTAYTPGTTAASTGDDGAHGHTATTATAGNHDHAGAVGMDGSHSHTVTVADALAHSHTIPEHEHVAELALGQFFEIQHGLYIGPVAADFYLDINGTDRTIELGGPWTANQEGLDVTQYLQVGLNTLNFRSSSLLGRIHATAFIDLYLKN